MIKYDSDNPGWIKAWVVLCEDPWKLYVCQTKSDAVEKAKELGLNFRAVYGSYHMETDDFIYSNIENPE